MRISVAMCTYNGEGYLAGQLRSIAEQSRRPDELIICDDGSTDGTQRVVRDFASASGLNIHWRAGSQRLGPAKNFERAIGLCRGDIIALSDQDDLWHADKLARLVERFAARDQPLLVFSDLCLIGASSVPTGRTQWQALGFRGARRRWVRQGRGFDLLLRYNVVTGAGLALRSALRDIALPLPDHWMHDEWLALVASAAGGLAMIEDVLQDYREHPSQQVGPGVGGWSAQLAHARTHMGSDYFKRMVARCEAAEQSLSACGEKLVRRDAPALMAERRRHYQTRLGMNEQGVGRIGTVLREWLSGRYRCFGYGWKSAAQDLFLR